MKLYQIKYEPGPKVSRIVAYPVCRPVFASEFFPSFRAWKWWEIWLARLFGKRKGSWIQGNMVYTMYYFRHRFYCDMRKR